jgi:hypothetical protein
VNGAYSSVVPLYAPAGRAAGSGRERVATSWEIFVIRIAGLPCSTSGVKPACERARCSARRSSRRWRRCSGVSRLVCAWACRCACSSGLNASESNPVLPGIAAAALAGLSVTVLAPEGEDPTVCSAIFRAGVGAALLASSRINGRKPYSRSASSRVRTLASSRNLLGSSYESELQLSSMRASLKPLSCSSRAVTRACEALTLKLMPSESSRRDAGHVSR